MEGFIKVGLVRMEIGLDA